MDYCVYHFKTEPKSIANDILIAFLAEYPFESFEETEQGFDAFIQIEHEVEMQWPELEGIKYTYERAVIETQNGKNILMRLLFQIN
jgi:hypothetical protein